MKLLTFSTLYPNAARRHHGIFVETSLRHLVATGAAVARVVAPVPWFPFRHSRFGSYALHASVPRSEVRAGIKVAHPRYPLLPKLGMTMAPFMLAQAARSEIGRMLDEGYDFDAIDAHYFYPDGVAAAMLGRYFNKPVVITALGSDINLLPNYAFPRRAIRWAAEHATAMIAVSQALKTNMVAMGIDAHRITVCRNGVDLNLFHPGERDEARERLGCDGHVLATVGNLIPIKGHDLAISALPALPETTLLIAGTGPERRRLEELARRLGVSGRVRFLGAMPQSDLRQVYVAADALVLASSREGWANVLLESMACGTPVVATPVGGTPELVRSQEAGRILAARSSAAIVEAVAELRARAPDRAATRRYAERYSWDDTTQAQLRLFQNACAAQERIAAPVSPQPYAPMDYERFDRTI